MSRSGRACLESLETRRLLAAVQPSALEQYMIELINRARSNPAAQAAMLGIDLNEGLPAGTISASAKQPLAVNPFLTDAARSHCQWIIDNDLFQHEGDGGSSPTDRMAAAGYAFTGSWGTSENLGIQFGGVFPSAYASIVASLHNGLFRDTDIAGRGHRLNMLNGAMREIGSGLATGSFVYNGTTYTALVVGQDLAYSGNSVFLTGVAYTDAVTDDDFYTVGEGLGGVTITARPVGGGTQYTTTTFDSGGYSLALPAGTYDIFASGGGLGGVVQYSAVTIAGENVKRDFTPDMVSSTPFAVLESGLLTVTGTPLADSIAITLKQGTYSVTLNGSTLRFTSSQVARIDILCGDGNDTVSAAGAYVPVYLFGDAGDDWLQGGFGNDTLTGAAGRDTLDGGPGDDRAAGGKHNDSIFGGEGADRLYGDEGHDTLDGQSGIDRIWGGDGDDLILGGASNDKLYGDAGSDTLRGGKGDDFFDGGLGVDHLFGDDGTDTAVEDMLDLRTSVEVLI